MTTSTALTRWLRQGLALGVCPLCRVAHKLDREFIWYFSDEYSAHGEVIDALSDAGGFCSEHAEQLRRLEVDGLRSTLGITLTYLDTLERVASELDSLRASERFGRAQCPACAHRAEGVRKNATYLLADIDESERTRARFLSSPGMCLPHFEQVWAIADGAQRELLLDVQRRALSEVVGALRKDVERQGSEQCRAWARAIALTAGWPAPDRSARVPTAQDGEA